jgi:hypothetical protein
MAELPLLIFPEPRETKRHKPGGGPQKRPHFYVQDWCPYHPESRPEAVCLWMEDGEVVCDCEDKELPLEMQEL